MYINSGKTSWLSRKYQKPGTASRFWLPSTVSCLIRAKRGPFAVIPCSGVWRPGITGHALEIRAEGVTLSGCDIRNRGSDLNALDAGIFVARNARDAVIENNRLQGPAFGIWLDAAADVTVRNNHIRGDTGLRSRDRGNGIHLFNTTGARIEGNHMSCFSFRNVSFRYDRNLVLHDMDLDLKAGEIPGLFGHNGAGKTTSIPRRLQ